MRYVLNEYLGLMTTNGYEVFAESSFYEEFGNEDVLYRDIIEKVKSRELIALEDESDMIIGKIYGCFRIDAYDDSDDEPIQSDDYYFEEKILK